MARPKKKKDPLEEYIEENLKIVDNHLRPKKAREDHESRGMSGKLVEEELQRRIAAMTAPTPREDLPQTYSITIKQICENFCKEYLGDVYSRLAKLEAIVFNRNSNDLVGELVNSKERVNAMKDEYVTKKQFDKIMSIQNVTIAELIKKVIELEEKIESNR